MRTLGDDENEGLAIEANDPNVAIGCLWLPIILLCAAILAVAIGALFLR